MDCVTREQLATWEKDGYLVMPSPFSKKEVELVQKWTDEIASWPTIPGQNLNYYENVDGVKTLSRTENFLHFHDPLKAFIYNSPLLKIIAEFVGEPVHIFKEKINYKVKGTGNYNPHQDIHSFDTSPLAFQEYHINCALAIDAATEENGCFQVVPGYKNELLERNSDGSIIDEIASQLPWKPVTMNAGDLLIFNCWVPHKSDRNMSEHSRRILYLTLNGVSKGDLREAHYRDRASGNGKTREINPDLFIDANR